jgi:hypothetical protein
MRILHVRQGFQADHSSSSYLFYAADHEVSEAGQRLAAKYSSRAEVDEHFARYQKWGESELNYEAYEKLLGPYYDVAASESYDWWTLTIAVPKTPALQVLLAPYAEARGDNDQGVDVAERGKFLLIDVHCQFDYSSSDLYGYEGDALDTLVELLADIRKEILDGNVSFLHAAADFYHAFEIEGEGSDEKDEEETPTAETEPDLDAMTKAELQEECTARDIDFRKSWTKAQLVAALRKSRMPAATSLSKGRSRSPGRLSKAAERIIGSLNNV